ncbi:hypothetical protein ABZP36_023017 [Zizania latifolia]
MGRLEPGPVSRHGGSGPVAETVAHGCAATERRETETQRQIRFSRQAALALGSWTWRLLNCNSDDDEIVESHAEKSGPKIQMLWERGAEERTFGENDVPVLDCVKTLAGSG